MPGSSKKSGPGQGSYSHDSARRPNLPTSEMVDDMGDNDAAPMYYRLPPRPPGSDPRLDWDAKWDPGEEVKHHPLFIQEKIHPSALVESLKRDVADPSMDSLFGDFNGLSEEQYTQWYQHPANWQNRLIHGNAMEICASLAEREGLEGKVQMIYFDPPYGIKFSSNFATEAGGTETKDHPESMGADPQSVKAFLDTWQDGIHSYLDAMHKHTRMAHALLADSGSLFVQIGDENMMRVGAVLDEVFGAGNRVATIAFAKTGSASSKTLPQVADFILWYAKDREEVKYRALHEQLNSRAEVVKLMNWDVMVEEPGKGGVGRTLTSEEKRDPDANLPEGSRLFQRMPLLAQHESATRSGPFTTKDGRTFPCPRGEQWRVSMEGLTRLEEKDRLVAQPGEKSLLRWKIYENEVPGRKINNLWSKQISTNDKRYVVQTANLAVERCLLMSTDPGDLVLDFTCGSGTTPYVAEKWGRRWIGVDASSVALATARTRLATATFDYYAINGSATGQRAEEALRKQAAEGLKNKPRLKSVKLAPGDEARDPAQGFVCHRVPKVSAAILAYDREDETPPTYLVDQPIRVSDVQRVCSPFTMESDLPYYLSVEEAATGDRVAEVPPSYYVSHHHASLSKLVDTGIRLLEGGHLEVEDLQEWPSGNLTHLASYRHEGETETKRMAIALAPEDITVPLGFLRAAAREARQQHGGDVDLLVVCGFAFAPDATEFTKHGTLPVRCVQMNRQFKIAEVEIKSKEDNGFVMLGEPDVQLHPEGEGKYSVEVKGFATFDPTSGNARFGDAKCIYSWMLDTDYDGRSFFARRMHFPGQHRDKQIAKLKKAFAKSLDTAAYEAMLSNRSGPFPKPKSGQVAVKIITRTGDEMTRILGVG